MERRRQPRVEVRDRVCVTVYPPNADAHEPDTFYCSTTDLSEGGLQFSGDTAFKKGQMLDLLVVRGSSFRGFEFRGRVAWVRTNPQSPSFSFGVAIADVSREVLLAWRDALEQLTPPVVTAAPKKSPGRRPRRTPARRKT